MTVLQALYAIGPIFNKDWLNGPHSGKTKILDNWTFASGLGGIENEKAKIAPLLLGAPANCLVLYRDSMARI